MKQIHFLSYFLCVAITSLLLGCDKDIAKEAEDIVAQEPEVFTLTATYGSADTKVAFDDDGLGLSWVPGDCLYLVDVNGNNSTVKLTTSITEPSKRASFTSSTSVLSGDYLVMYGCSTLSSIHPSSILSTDNDLSPRIILYGKLTVSDGQTSAAITLNHAFAKLKFTFKNIPSSFSPTSLGMAVASEGIPYSGQMTSSGFDAGNNPWLPICSLGNNVIDSGMSVLVAPCNYSGTKVFFYCYDTYGNYHITYEIQKQGIDLKAGNNYNIEFDFSKATISTIANNVLNTAADFRAAAYWKTNNAYSVNADIDFTDEVYLPISCQSINGNNHTLSNISISYAKCDSIGLISSGYAENIALMNANVLGRNNVGAISGCLKTGKGATTLISKCIVKGSTIIEGRGNVGGLFGVQSSNSITVSQCGFEGEVRGSSLVGGIIGSAGNYSSFPIKLNSVYSKGNVSGTNNIGGIVGYDYSYCSILNSYHIGNVTGEGSYIGGISGAGCSISYCYSNGAVTGNCGISFKQSSASCITSCSRISNSSSPAEYCNFNSTKTFLSGLSIINVQEAYSTQVWPDIAEQCPLLQWQSDALNGDIDIPGYNDVDW